LNHTVEILAGRSSICRNFLSKSRLPNFPGKLVFFEKVAPMYAHEFHKVEWHASGLAFKLSYLVKRFQKSVHVFSVSGSAVLAKVTKFSFVFNFQTLFGSGHEQKTAALFHALKDGSRFVWPVSQSFHQHAQPPQISLAHVGPKPIHQIHPSSLCSLLPF
jgi:hypothetical protein